MITPVLLCGGSGTRLWPLSRKSYPKQFADFLGGGTLFQSSAERFSGEPFAAPLILTNSDFRFIVTEQLATVGIDPGAILIEPEARNTAPAILAAALWLQKTDPNGIMIVAPSDHIVPDTDAFQAAVLVGEASAREGQVVTFGVAPTHPETAYGYLELESALPPNSTEAVALKSFVEKPDNDKAKQLFSSGNHLWNAGIFMFSVETIINAFSKHAPHLIGPVVSAVEKAKVDLGFLRLSAESWGKAESISIDYAIMERAQNLSVVPFSGGWSDLGGWDAVWRDAERDGKGVALAGPATAIDCKDSLLRSEDSSVEIVGIGLENIVAVAMQDAVLVADIRRSQDVKYAVAALKKKAATQAETFPKEHRPWGWFESLVKGERFQVKRIVVHAGAALSLQSHHHRSEHWIVVEGTARVTVDETIKLITENESIYVPVGAVHRMDNPGKMPMVLIEVQTGSYLGEDDIIRYEDDYARDH